MTAPQALGNLNFLCFTKRKKDFIRWKLKSVRNSFFVVGFFFLRIFLLQFYLTFHLFQVVCLFYHQAIWERIYLWHEQKRIEKSFNLKQIQSSRAMSPKLMTTNIKRLNIFKCQMNRNRSEEQSDYNYYYITLENRKKKHVKWIPSEWESFLFSSFLSFPK